MFSLKDENKTTKLMLFCYAIIMIFICTFSAFYYNDYLYLGSLQKMNNDDVKYIRSAWTLMDKGIFTYQATTLKSVFIMPGHPFILAFFMSIFGKMEGITAFRIFQGILQGIGLYLIFFIGKKAFNSKIGIIASTLDFLYIPEYMSAGLVLTEVEFKFLLLSLIYFSMYALDKNKLKYYIEAAIIWGLSCLIRPTIAPYPIIILIMWIALKYKFKDMVKYTVIVSTIFCLIMSPWWIRNYKVFNKFIPTTLSTGSPFLLGTYVNNNRHVDYVEHRGGKNEIESNEIEMETGIYRLKTYFPKKPMQYIYWYTIGKTWFLWEGPFYWLTIFNVSDILPNIYHGIIVILGILGIAFTCRGKNKIYGKYLIGIIGFFTAVYLPFYTCSRYGYPEMPIVMILASVAICKIGGKLCLSLEKKVVKQSEY